jgi:hypothetical protein
MNRLAILALASAALSARADEGMWTYDGFPKDELQRRHGFRPDDRWLEAARLASVRLAQGCSASFVSGSGLVMTNHHCAHSCIEQLSTRERDFVKSGFLARGPAEEVKCPELEVDQLAAIVDVTARVQKATAGLEGGPFGEAQRAEMARIEKECQTADTLRCEVVSLYHGGRYDLYRYRRYQDVRLVFAPEFAIAFFGGDPDNFMFPRYDLDLAFLRIYEGGEAARTPSHFAWSARGAREGELTFVSGNPGHTERRRTVAQLEYARDTLLPDRLLLLAERRGQLTEYQRRGPEQARHSNATLFYVENSYKALRGELQALQDRAFFQTKVDEEARLEAAAARDPERGRRVREALRAIAEAEAEAKKIRKALWYQEGGGAFAGQLFGVGRTLVRAAAERPKPSETRLREYRDSALPAVTQKLFSPAPIHDEFEVFNLTWSLTKMREELGPDDPFVKKVLGPESPEELAARLVKGTRLRDVEQRKKLWEGGQAAVVAASREDPILDLAIRVDGTGRAVRKSYEDGIEAVVKKSEEVLAKARFEVWGTSVYPDATFTPRLSFGKVAGWVENGKPVPPITTFAGAYERATGRDPFALPQSWLDARTRLDLSTPFDFVATNDIIGGNSGSPVFNQAREIVGLAFDGNIWSLGGDYGFDESRNRMVAVHSAAIVEALEKIYGARRLVDELRSGRRAER